MQVRVAILVTSVAAKKSVRLAKEFSKLFKPIVVVDGMHRYPHITLFDLALPNALKLGHLKKVLLPQPFIIKVNGFYSTTSGHICLKVQNVKATLVFRKKIIKVLEAQGFKPNRKSNQPFKPHVTMLRYKDHKAATRVKEARVIKFDFKAKVLAFTLIDKHGQVYKIIKEFKLN